MKAWKKKINRIRNSYKNIFKGFYYTLFKYYKIECISKERLKICRTNKCCHYDKHGTSDMAIGNMGKETCAVCGCILKIKTRVMDEHCPLDEIKVEPLWSSVNIEKYDCI
jgi:hypothetical protein